MKRLATTLASLLMAGLLLGAGGYQRHTKGRCDWCGKPGTVLNRLVVAHIAGQTRHPDLRDDPENCRVTLHHRTCHFVVAHRTNWTNECYDLGEIIDRYGYAATHPTNSLTEF